MNDKIDFDVAILGGGLAGSTLALQLLKSNPNIKIAIFDKRKYPIKPATCKVGESTVEIGAHYYSKIIGLEEHLLSDQIEKLGLRYFLESDNNDNIENRMELGATKFSVTPSYQLDRGILENHLKEKVDDSKAQFFTESIVKSVALDGDGPHTIEVQLDGERRAFKTKWVIDASGRTGILSNKMYKRIHTGHSANSSWWRVNHKIKIDDWGTDAWKNIHTDKNGRWQSTVHLTGRGYWVWLIPLSSGYTSVGIVVDNNIHDFRDINTLEKSFNWLKKHEPQCYEISKLHEDKIEDFLVLRDYSYGREKVFSKDRWAFTGEAGVFPDPFYSPGSDFIATSNTYITDLITRDMQGERFGQRAEHYNDIYLKFFDSVIRLFRDQYHIYGNPLLLPLKVFWDWTFHWNFMARIFFEGRLCDLSFMAKERLLIERMANLGAIMQEMLSEWNKHDRPKSTSGRVDLSDHGILRELNRTLGEKHKPEDFDVLFKQGARLVESIATELALYRQKRTGLPIPEEISTVPTFNVLESYIRDVESNLSA